MALEDLTGDKYIDSLNSANPIPTDNRPDGVGHFQGIKNILKKTFANITGAVTATQADLDKTKQFPTISIADALKGIRVNSGGTGYEVLTLGDMLASNNLSDVVSASTARTNLGLEIGVDVQAYDATILKVANLGSTVQTYDVDTAKLDLDQSWSGKQTFSGDLAMNSQFVIKGSGYIASPTTVLALPTNTNSVYLGGSGALVVNYVEDQTPGAEYVIYVGNHSTTFKHSLGAPGTGQANLITFTGADLTVPAYSAAYCAMSGDGNSFSVLYVQTSQSKLAATQTPTKGRILIGDGSNWSPLTVGTNNYVLTADSAASTGTKWAAAAAGGMTMFAAESLGISYQKTRSLSGTVERIEVAFAGVSVNSGREIVIALGSGGSLTRSGYASESREEVTPTATYGSTGFVIFPLTNSNYAHSGVATLVHLGSNVWTISGSCYEDNTSNMGWFGGYITLAGACNIVGFGIENGSSTDTSTHFDAGTWKVSYQTS